MTNGIPGLEYQNSKCTIPYPYTDHKYESEQDAYKNNMDFWIYELKGGRGKGGGVVLAVVV